MKISASSLDLISKMNDIDTIYHSKEKTFNNSILVTGGSGFLGIHLLHDLVNKNEYNKIYTIVRNSDKLKQQAIYFNLNPDFLDKINIIKSDLHDLKDIQFPDVQYIIHSAAQIHCLKTLKQLWKDNVLLTDKICKIYQNNSVSFISTLSVFVSSNQTGLHHPLSLPQSNDYFLYGGYAQSKFICEKIAEKYNHQIIRLGLVTGSSTNGIFPNDFFTTYIKNIKKIKHYPIDFETSFIDLTPVDFCSEQIIDNIKKETKILHIANKHSFSINNVINLLKLTPVSNDIFDEIISNLPNLDQFLLKYSFFKSKMLISHPDYFNLDLFQSTNHYYDIIDPFPISNEKLFLLYMKKNGDLNDRN